MQLAAALGGFSPSWVQVVSALKLRRQRWGAAAICIGCEYPHTPYYNPEPTVDGSQQLSFTQELVADKAGISYIMDW
jgi:hypothetical protein